MDTIKVETPPCMLCNQRAEMELDATAFAHFEAGAKVQDAFPGMPANERELLISGTHPRCFIEMFGS